ncbi:hypothetical protein M501DRAFT_943789 [Patellaria atrata CBS 101060]|uniref:A-kinase anchor protein 7-like phosphoesterase domain-containing protein n=1 Tax=Patellaria atrata CBS 101060 TaxID=1346257 RepID=A0A9P4S3Z5_9PEZI|nr:hypothetical protein M501DRAFT_943789 [Patellaria atrata CBS 101060]
MARKRVKSGKTSGPTTAKKPPLTHFLCFPLVTEASRPILQESMNRFAKAIIRAEDGSYKEDPIFPPAAIRPVGTLHLTLGVMSLPKPEQLEGALSLLKSLDVVSMLKDIDLKIKGVNEGKTVTPLVINLKSLSTTKGPTKASNLFAPPEDLTSRLQPFAEALKNLFTDAGFMFKEERRLTLHATVVNTIYARPGGRGTATEISKSTPAGSVKAPPKARGPIKFDATPLLARYKDYVWANKIRIEKVAICKMGATKILDESGKPIDAAYEEVASIPLP